MFVFCQVYDGERLKSILFGILTLLFNCFMTHKKILQRVKNLSTNKNKSTHFHLNESFISTLRSKCFDFIGWDSF
jgi:hypothetical protein